MNHCALSLLISLHFLYHQIKNAGKTNLVFDLLRDPSTPRCQWSAIDCKCFCCTVNICYIHLTFQTQSLNITLSPPRLFLGCMFVTEKFGAVKMDQLLFCARPKAVHYQHRGR